MHITRTCKMIRHLRKFGLDFVCLIVCAGHVTAPKKISENVKRTKAASKHAAAKF